MALAKCIETTVHVELTVNYVGRRPIDARRIKYIENKLQEYASGELSNSLAALRFSDEQQ